MTSYRIPKHFTKYISIIADDREQKSSVIDYLRERDNVFVEIKRLPLGDYFAGNRLLLERKTLKDFAVSLADGRLFKQAVHLANSKYKSVMILEGSGKDLAETGMRREALQGALITVSLILGIPVLRSLSSHETARLILYASRQIEFIVKGAVQRPGNRPKAKRKKQLYLLQGLPGIGRRRAERLLDVFGSVEAVITASCEELQAVDGVGKGLAEKIRWMVSEKVNDYGADELFTFFL